MRDSDESLELDEVDFIFDGEEAKQFSAVIDQTSSSK